MSDGGPADCADNTAATLQLPDASAFCFNGFTWESPLPQGSTLEAIWGPGPNDVWAGGAAGLLMHWDGRSWTSHQGEIEFDTTSADQLGAISSFATTPTRTWLAGFDLAPHFLEDAGNSWARGGQTPANGASWRVAAMGVSDDGTNGPYAVTPNGEVFALDDWRQVSAPPNMERPDYVSSLVVGADGLVAFSGTFQSTNGVHRVWNVDGGYWTLDAGEAGALWFERGLLLTAGTNRNVPVATVWALNNDGGTSAYATRAGDATFTGASFVPALDAGYLVGSGGVITTTKLVNVRVPATETTDLLAVQAFADGGGWAVGTGGALVHQEPSGWNSRSQGLGEELFDVGTGDDGGVFVCGSGSAVIERGTWNRTPAGSGRLRSCRWLKSTSRWLVAAEDGNLYANTNLVYRADAGNRPLMDLLVEDDQAWAVGTGTVIHRQPDGGWITETPPGLPGQEWWKIARAGSHFMVAGSNAVLGLYTLDGGWNLVTESTGASLFGVWTIDADAGTAWVVGGGPSIRRFDAVAGSFSTPEDLPTGIYSPLFDVWGLAPDDVWAVGDEGIVMHYDGSTWSRVESGTRNQLERVRAHVLPDGTRELIIVGSRGTVLRHRY